MCSKLTIKTLERRHSGVYIVNFEHILHLFLVPLLLTLKKQMSAGFLSMIIIIKLSDGNCFKLCRI